MPAPGGIRENATDCLPAGIPATMRPRPKRCRKAPGLATPAAPKARPAITGVRRSSVRSSRSFEPGRKPTAMSVSRSWPRDFCVRIGRIHFRPLAESLRRLLHTTARSEPASPTWRKRFVRLCASRLLVGALTAAILSNPRTALPQRQPLPRPVVPPTPAASITYDTSVFAALKWREIGPYRGGRSVAVAGSSKRPNEYYFGTTGGGVFKTTDGGITWTAVTDKYFGGTIGAIGISESNPDVVYVG